MSAGYSGTPLIKKLGLKSGMALAFVDAPLNYMDTLGRLPDDAVVIWELNAHALADLGIPLDFIQFFAHEKSILEAAFSALKSTLPPDGILWISWPKKASKVKTDLDENVIRELGLANGLVDVKVAAVDEVWSGLKFVYRLADR
jgi:hypothetical protein